MTGDFDITGSFGIALEHQKHLSDWLYEMAAYNASVQFEHRRAVLNDTVAQFARHEWEKIKAALATEFKANPNKFGYGDFVFLHPFAADTFRVKAAYACEAVQGALRQQHQLDAMKAKLEVHEKALADEKRAAHRRAMIDASRDQDDHHFWKAWGKPLDENGE